MSSAVEVHAAPSLWSANFRLYFGARTGSLLGDAMLPVALSVGVLQAGYGTAGVGYALGAWMAALALCMLFGGVLADRFTARRMIVLADLVPLVIQGGIAVMFATGTPALSAIVALQFLSGLATTMFQPGVASLVPQVADDVQRRTASCASPSAWPATSARHWPASWSGVRPERRVRRLRHYVRPECRLPVRAAAPAAAKTGGESSCASSPKAGTRSAPGRGCGA